MSYFSSLAQVKEEHYSAIITLLLSKVNDCYRYMSDVADLTANGGDVLAYLCKVNSDSLTLQRAATTHNTVIDIALQRYLIETAMSNITLEVDIDSMENLSNETTLQVLSALKSCFKAVFLSKKEKHILLTIEAHDQCVIIAASTSDNRIFTQKIAIAE